MSDAPAKKSKPKIKFEPFPPERWGKATYLVGDVHQTLAAMPENSVDLVMTSPPFLALRSYLPDDHPDKAREIGNEGTPGAFLDAMLDVIEALDRVLAPHGSIVIELGDTYAGSGGAGGDYNAGGMRSGSPKFDGSMKHARIHDPSVGPPIQNKNGRKMMGGVGWPRAKSKVLIPELFAVALAYGFNPLTGREIEPWLVRNVVAWCRPNPPVGALGDKFRPATSYLTIATKNPKRFFDLDAVRGPGSPNTHARLAKGAEPRPNTGKSGNDERRGGNYSTLAIAESSGAPPLDWWEIPTQPYKGSHYATFPEALVVRPVLSMCPERVCATCDMPSTRITGKTSYVNARSGDDVEKAQWRQGELNRQGAIGRDNGALRVAETLGFTDCGHNDWRRGIVLDPFAGSGTTLRVATMLGRDAIGIDLDERNVALARGRLDGVEMNVLHNVRAKSA